MFDHYGPAIWVPGPDFGFPNQGDHGRAGFPIRYIIVHGTASPGMDLDAWIRVGRQRGGVHFMIGQDGRVVQFLPLSDASWGNGIVTAGHDAFWDTWKTSDPALMYAPGTGVANPNLTTISIEHVKLTTHNTEAITPAQQAASFALIDWLCTNCGIPRKAADAEGGITGHHSMDPVRKWFCPGPYPMSELLTFLNAPPQSPAPSTSPVTPAEVAATASFLASPQTQLPPALLAAVRSLEG